MGGGGGALPSRPPIITFVSSFVCQDSIISVRKSPVTLYQYILRACESFQVRNIMMMCRVLLENSIKNPNLSPKIL